MIALFLGNLIGLDQNILIDIVLPYENGMLLPTLNTFLVSNKRHLIKESLWVLSNIFSCKLEKKHVEELQLALPNVSRHLVSAYEIKKEVCRCCCCCCRCCCRCRRFLPLTLFLLLMSLFFAVAVVVVIDDGFVVVHIKLPPNKC